MRLLEMGGRCKGLKRKEATNLRVCILVVCVPV